MSDSLLIKPYLLTLMIERTINRKDTFLDSRLKQQRMSHQKKNESSSKSNASEIVTLKTLIEESGETAVKIYTLAKMTKTVWFLRMNNPERFTFEEMQGLAEALTKIATLYDRPAVTIQTVFDAIQNTIKQSASKKSE